MEELKRALLARGMGAFTPVFDSKIHQLGNGAWFCGWEVRGFDKELIAREARFGRGSSQEKWVDPTVPTLLDHPDPEFAEAAARSAREARAQDILRHMSELVILESAQLENAAPSLQPLPAQSEFPSVPIQVDGKGKEIAPPHQLVADSLVRGFGDHFLRDGEDPFYWQGTHWQARNATNFRRYIMNAAQGLRSSEAKHSELVSIYELFMNSAPALDDGHTFYQQNPFLANFLDGTLEVKKNKDGTFEKIFREHRAEDLLTWVLPYHYKAPRPRNPVFEEWIAKAFSADEDGAGKVRALKQIGGACLVSMFPRICFLLSSQGGTGKSTFAKLCMRFMGQGNYSAVPPHLMEGFLMESMIGKQANIVTDIGKKAVIPEDFMKLVEDGIPVLVNRKGRQAVFARIPALHLFCANALPRGIDGDSNAMDRRVTIVEFTKSMLGEGTPSAAGAYTRDYQDVILNAGSGAVLDFFEDGLDDLIQSNGIYFNPDSGKRILGDWKNSESLVSQLLESLDYGELLFEGHPLVRDPNGRIARSRLNTAVQEWAGKPLHNQHVSRIFKELEGRGFRTALSSGNRYVLGIRESSITDRI